MATQRRTANSASSSNSAGNNNSSHASSNSLSGGYHNPAIIALPQTSDPQQILAQSHPELVEAALTLYESNYSDAQFDEAISHFAPNIEFMDPGLHTFNRPDLKAQFTYLRKWFTSFHPIECNIATSADRIYIDLLMDWKLAKGRVSLKVRHILRAKVEAGQITWMEDTWSVNDRVGALLGALGLYEPIRWLITYPSTKYMRWQLGY